MMILRYTVLLLITIVILRLFFPQLADGIVAILDKLIKVLNDLISLGITQLPR